MTAIRVTPMLLSKNIDLSAAPFVQIGFVRQNTEDSGCVGLIGQDGTSVMLLHDDYARRSMPAKAVDVLAEKGGLYLWVDELPAHANGEQLGEAITEYGTRERFVKQAGQLIVYAQKLMS